MRITAAILLVCSMHVTAKSLSQTITLSATNMPVKTVFEEIHRQCGYFVFYDPDVVNKVSPVTVDVKNAPLLTFLEEILDERKLAYTIENKTIVIKQQRATNFPNQTPPIDIKGKVTDENGDPVAGAAVQIKGTERVTLTNENGEFTITDIEENATLMITGVNIEDVEYKLKDKKNISIKAKLKISNLNEVVVNKGYYSEKQRLSTGNVSTVTSKDIEKQPVNNPLLALQGRVPGLFITQATGLPGTGVEVSVQGKNSISNGNDPFYVIDGVPYSSQLLTNYGSILGRSTSGTNGNPLNFINPADIESISVLKDADATAIYGSRGANGVILITTKKGKAGQTRVNVNMQSGVAKVTRKMDLLNTEQYLEMRHEAKSNDNSPIDAFFDYDIAGLWDTTRYTDWQRELIGNTANYRDANLTVSGGNANVQVLIGAGYHKETTVFPGNHSDQKGSLHFNVNTVSTNQKLRVMLTGSYVADNNRIIPTDLTQFAMSLAPNAPQLYNDDQSLNWMPDLNGSSSWDNPLALLNGKYKNKTKNLVGNAVASYQLLQGLEIKSSFGYTNLQSDEVVVNPLSSIKPEERPTFNRFANYSNNNVSSWIIEPQLSYKRDFGSGRFEGLVGCTFQQNNTKGLLLRGEGYNSDLVMEDVKSSYNIVIDGSVNAEYKYNAIFSRLSYNLLERYLINVTARRDLTSSAPLFVLKRNTFLTPRTNQRFRRQCLILNKNIKQLLSIGALRSTNSLFIISVRLMIN